MGGVTYTDGHFLNGTPVNGVTVGGGDPPSSVSFDPEKIEGSFSLYIDHEMMMVLLDSNSNVSYVQIPRWPISWDSSQVVPVGND